MTQFVSVLHKASYHKDISVLQPQKSQLKMNMNIIILQICH